VTLSLESVPPTSIPARARPQLRPARFDDYEQIARLEAALTPEASSPDDWRMLWHGSPLWPHLGKRWPIGWVLETEDREIVGCIGNIPLLYHLRGEHLMAASGRGWVVAPEYRGYALWLLDERFNQACVDLFIDTTIGPAASSAFNEFSNRIPVGDWETISYFITSYSAFATRAMRKLNLPLARVLAPSAGAALRLKDVILGRGFPKTHSAYTIESTDRFDSRFDAFWDELLRQNPDKLLAARDGATLSWHYSVPMRRGRLWILTASQNRQLRAYCIFKRHGATADVRRMRLVDYQTIDRDVDLLPDFLTVALRKCVAEDVCVLDKPGIGVGRTHAFDTLAPYRRKQTWPYFYRAIDGGLAVELRQPKFWDPGEYDGDASIE
jgi:hypothetical protein